MKIYSKICVAWKILKINSDMIEKNGLNYQVKFGTTPGYQTKGGKVDIKEDIASL